MNPVNYSDIRTNLAARGIDDRDCLNSRGRFSWWCDQRGYLGLDPEGKERGSSQVWLREYRASEDGHWLEQPYCNLWHWFLNEFEGYGGGEQGAGRWVYTATGRHLDCLVRWSEIEPVWVKYALQPILDANGGEITVRLNLY